MSTFLHFSDILYLPISKPDAVNLRKVIAKKQTSSFNLMFVLRITIIPEVLLTTTFYFRFVASGAFRHAVCATMCVGFNMGDRLLATNIALVATRRPFTFLAIHRFKIF
ncbi:MAG: hypothetical protein A3C06_00020 [Candidatus Taylorbacteria bacterium RIFCSPHIGHO2_02_FULL_46_13]|uniref:Uncharacterized protein n=1 Tax=Candidatus Taylorbacteria bacterium RIFCSPHIGHO2_02_FULL_46_13 TaxID=1802312 RepID=A0A1G2MTV6_9BACT|nr:MAG: hypothetical protein A3C06_00020 [Candidatus Taylorbacteria bacterium RIFCSPHIGHO2_02_FULL_46_13]